MNKIALMMRVTLEAESINNEGSVGNVLIPREIELSNGETRQAISGEMLKHYHQVGLRRLAADDELCDSCKLFSPMKNGKIKDIDDKLSVSGNRVKNCIIDDIHGFANLESKDKSTRESRIKFSWGIAVEEKEYQSTLHSRVEVQSEKNCKKKKVTKKEDNIENSNEDIVDDKSVQMIFHRPLRSNEYATVIQIDLDSIGLDDEKMIYTLDTESIKQREIKCLIALRNMFLDVEGALCSTRLPHLTNIEGIIVHKTNPNDVLVKYSPLKDDYKEINKKLATNSYEFNNVVEFSQAIDELITMV